MKAQLTVVEGALKGTCRAIEERGTIMVGRAVKTGLKLAGDTKASRNHCMVELAAGRLFLQDLESRNGTFVNGRRVVEAELHTGARIAVGNTLIEITLIDARPSPSPAGALRCVRCKTDLDEEGAFATSADGFSGTVICRSCSEEIAEAPDFIPGMKSVRKLGEGGMGAVHLVAKADGTLAAVKTLRPEVAQTSDVVAMFLREAAAGARIEHPNAVPFYAPGFSHGTFYFVMEFIDGPDLAGYMKQLGRPFTLAEAAPVMAQLLDVVEAVHAQKLVHRYIKPSNVMVSAPLPAPCVKLTDFGLMRSFQATGFTLITKTGQGKGTPHYMAPEQIDDARHAGPPADVYALAATFFEMLAGKTPLKFEAHRNKILTILEDLPRVLHAENPAVPRAVSDIRRSGEPLK